MVSNIVDRIELLRRDLGYSQALFARKCGITPSNFNKMLHGTMPVSEKTLNRIVEAFNASYKWLHSNIGEMYASERSAGESNYRRIAALNAKARAVSVNTASGENSRATQTIGMPDEEVSALREEVAALKARLSVMEKVLEDKDRLIERLLGTLPGGGASR